MRKMMMLMNVLMGFSMSLLLSLVGTVSGGHFSLPSWLLSFAISFVISLLIGFAIPIKKVSDAFCNKCHVIPESLKGVLLSGIVSDLIYTPVITVVMVVVMLKLAAKHAPAGAVPPVAVVLPGSMILCLIVGYIAIVILQPLFVKMLMRKGKKVDK